MPDNIFQTLGIRDARGITPRQPGEPKQEEIIRRMRDDCDTPEGEKR